MNLAHEANFDGLIGPTHNYGGLSDGNIASSRHSGQAAFPKAAALQGLAKMRMLAEKGLWQGVLPPQQRPFLPGLRACGFSGTGRQIYEAAWRTAPRLMRNMLSASSMWAANAATVSPSPDCEDGRLNLTPANLNAMLHRSIEDEQTGRALARAFPFANIHSPLPAQRAFADEGAANHVRLCGRRAGQGVELFVYGRGGFDAAETGFPARQSLEASRAIARAHGLNPARIVFAQQSRAAINAGAFHNDVVCVGAMQTLFYHELAFADTAQMQSDITRAAKDVFGPIFIEVSEADIPIGDVIKSYLFNSMLVQFPGDDRLSLIAPMEAAQTPSVAAYCEKLTASNGPIGKVEFVDVRQSMQNGGGPACLRLRVTMTEGEWAKVNPKMKLDGTLYDKLCAWVNTHYRDELAPSDLVDPALMEESFAALDALTTLLDLGSGFYPFQR